MFAVGMDPQKYTAGRWLHHDKLQRALIFLRSAKKHRPVLGDFWSGSVRNVT
jgi:hypothetical protein